VIRTASGALELGVPNSERMQVINILYTICNMATERKPSGYSRRKLICTEFNAIILGCGPRIFELLDPEDGDIIMLRNIGIYLISSRHGVTPKKN